MTGRHAGYLDFDDQMYRFETARCTFNNGQLDVEADGRKCKLKLYGIPFTDAETIARLAGKSSDPDSVSSDPIAEGGIEIGDESFLSWQSLKVRCEKYNPEENTLSVSFQAEVEDYEWGNNGPVDGSVLCDVQDEL